MHEPLQPIVRIILSVHQAPTGSQSHICSNEQMCCQGQQEEEGHMCACDMSFERTDDEAVVQPLVA